MTDFASDRPPPSWVRRDHTRELLNQLREATCDLLPPATVDGNKTKRLATMLYQAGIKLEFRTAYFNRFVEVYIAIPTLMGPNDHPLPDSMYVLLSETELRQSRSLRDQYSVSDAAAAPTDAFSRKARQVEWSLVQLIVGRIDNYRGILEAGLNRGRLAASFAVGFVSTQLSLAGMALDSTGVESPVARMLTSCPAFLLGAATTSLSAPLGLGLIGLVGTLESFVECYQSLEKLAHTVQTPLARESNVKQVAAASANARARPSNYYEVIGDKLHTFQDRTPRDSSSITDPSKSEIRLNYHDGCSGKGEFSDRVSDGRRDRCCRFEYFGRENQRSGIEHSYKPDTGEVTVKPIHLP